MALRVLGIDLGAHSVKIVDVEAGFQAARLAHLRTIGVPAGGGPLLLRSLEALREGGKLPAADVVAVGVPGDRALMRLLSIPITDPKRLGAVVGNELADDLPWETEQVVFDHMLVPGHSGKVLAVAARTDELRALLVDLTALGAEPRALPVATLAYASLTRRLDTGGPVVVIDIGHLRTNVCLIEDGRALFGRTISRAGHQITEAFRQTFQLTYAEAEALKEREALLVVGEQPTSPYAAVTAQAIGPLIRDLRLTIGLLTARLGVRPQRLLLCGGSSLIRGIDSFLTVETGVPAQRLPLELGTAEEGGALAGEAQAIGALAVGLALERGGRQGIDLRQGEFAYHADTSVFKDKMITIAVSVVLVLLFAAGNAYMSLHALRKEEKTLTARLKRATQDVFGEAVENPRTISKRVKQGSKAISSGIPQRTAYDILHSLSTNIPGSDKVKLDITRLEIKPGKTYITGTTNTRSGVDDIVNGLEKDKCFTKISTGTISDVAEGKKQFSLTITTDCF
jgi:general secretion pathway protein L